MKIIKIIISVIPNIMKIMKERKQNYIKAQNWARSVIDNLGPYDGKKYLEAKIKEPHMKDFARGVKSVIKSTERRRIT